MARRIRVFCALVSLTTIVFLGSTVSYPGINSSQVTIPIKPNSISREMGTNGKENVELRENGLGTFSSKESASGKSTGLVRNGRSAYFKKAKPSSEVPEAEPHPEQYLTSSGNNVAHSKEARRNSNIRGITIAKPSKERAGALPKEAKQKSEELKPKEETGRPKGVTDNQINNQQNAFMKPRAPKLPGFVRKGAKCQVLVEKHRTELPTCSTDLFREYYSIIGSFPECGMWLDTLGYGFSQRYGLDFCDFKAYNLPECSLRKRLHHILMLGDSTGWRTFMGLVNTTIWGGNTCHLVVEEGPFSMLPSTTYFSLGRRSLQNSLNVEERRCGWCRAAVYDCEMRTNTGLHTVRLEFAPAYKFKDPSLTISPGNPKWRSSRTFQEFLFNTYVRLAGMPDAIVVDFPLNHEKRNQQVVQDFKALVDVMVEHVPRTTQVHWIPTASEFESRRHGKSAKFINTTFGNEKLLASEQIYKINTMLFSELKPYLLNSSYNMHGFVNLVNMSSAKETWNEDGVHYNYLWYLHVIRVLLSMVCAD
ncbi:hypothetical protein CAPTEDRAFT_188748 [Capitella teleta]|uniref:SGNH domain-containing protein n=1 Tax=Capitella teleta TaxID=283909 RepID=R7TD86_CAPTE|nr:hypothetical protein CAPTEDRAFT_188748 [Capitella teleta]|eukprot:ELT89031.1 hypothetical protein CAPTEDRAFT_188748 [Capitella teleta]